ncbi:permease prefix domain 1-containing protein [Dysosmobacter sp.]
MERPETIQAYLETLGAQIRWKRARSPVVRELEAHLEDQREAFAAEGHLPEDAERLAVEEMGDPVALGAELDRVHRPRPQWGLLTAALGLALLGGVLRVWLTAGVEHESTNPLRTALALALGCACLLGMYFLDYSRLLRRAGMIYLGALILGALALRFSPVINGTSYYTRYVVLLYPTVYALWLYHLRQRGWKGFFAAVSGGVPLAAVTLLAAGCKAGFFKTRLTLFLHPELDPLGGGYQAVMVRKALTSSRWLGTGNWDGPYPYERMVPEWNRDFLLTTVIHKLGCLPFLLLTVAAAGFLAWLLLRGLRQQSQPGRLIALSVVLSLGLQAAASVIQNLGYVLFSASMPLIVGNLISVVDMTLIGLVLSVFRGAFAGGDENFPGCGGTNWGGMASYLKKRCLYND